MKKLGVVLALLVLGSLLTVGVGKVSAEEFINNVPNVNYQDAYIELIAYTSAADVSETILTATAQSMIEGIDSHVNVVYWIKDHYVHVRATLTDDTNVAVLLRVLGPVKMDKQYSETALEAILSAAGVNYDKNTVLYESNIIRGRVRVYAAVAYGTNVYVTFTASEGYLKGFDYHDSWDHQNKIIVDGKSIGRYPNWYYLNNNTHTVKVYAHDDYGKNCKEGVIYIGSDRGFSTAPYPEDSYEVANFVIYVGNYNVHFEITDALTGQPLQGVTVVEGNKTLGVINSGESLLVGMGTHTLTFEKEGYRSVTKTVDVQNDTSVSVELYPSSAAFKLENFPSEITIPEHTVYTLTFTLSPIDTSATYNIYLSLSGLSDVLEVRKDGSVISPEGGKYYLGDISGPTQVSIKFKAGSVGTYAFSITLESSDAFGANTYTTTKQISYKVDPLPFSIQMPSEWQVGDNELRVSEASGQSYSMIVILKDSSGAEVWSGSYAFSPYEVHTFTVNVPQEGSYTLEFQWNGQTASYTINVGTGISLLTKSVSVKKGGVGTVQVQLKNPSDSTKYYTIRLEGGFLDVPVNQTVAIAPSSTKTVSIAFAVPENVQFDAYDLTLKVLEGDAVRYSDTVHVIITGSEGSGLLPIGGGSSGSTLLLLGAAAALGLGAVLVMRRR